MATTILHAAQAGLSAYSLFHAYISITNLQKWESTSEKAAQYSETAAKELHKTRTTQTSGALTLLLSLLSALSLTIGKAEGGTYRLLLNTVNVGTCLFARKHVGDFWAKKGKVPLAGAYNTAINSTQEIMRQLEILAGAWVVSSLLAVGGMRG